MRKILLATTALVAFASVAQAAESPVQVTLGGYVDFRAAKFHESSATGNLPTAGASRASGDFQTQYGVNIAADGKAAGGVTYGAVVELDNKAGLFQNATEANGDLKLDQGYVHVGGNFGKVTLGDAHGATDLLVFAPTVGEGQIDGSYTNFTDFRTLARLQPMFFDASETATKIGYFTPKVGNANHKVQVGASFAPNSGTGIDSKTYKNDSLSYKNNIEVVAQYTGAFSPVSVVVTPMYATGKGENGFENYNSWGLGAQAMYAGFTFGGSYVDADDVNLTTATKGKDQNVWTVGLKYEFDKVAVAANYMKGKGVYYFGDSVADADYVNSFKAIGLGATYTWFPGMTTAADAVIFNQSREDASVPNNKGHVLMLSQKMAF